MFENKNNKHMKVIILIIRNYMEFIYKIELYIQNDESIIKHQFTFASEK